MSNNQGGLTCLQKIGIIAGILAVVVPAGWAIYRYLKKQERIKDLERLAETYQHHDEFGKAANALKEALQLDPESREIKIRLVEIKTFKTATEYDQIKLVSNKQVVPELKDTCVQLYNEVGQVARIIALCGIVQELDDKPTQAVQEYQRASQLDPGYVNVHNYWGYTRFKWNLGDAHWATDALSEFSKAIQIDDRYAIAYMNTAVVLLVQDDLEKAKDSLETATRLLPDSPRIHLLWGHYHLKLGWRLQHQNLPDSQRMFQNAVDHLEQARNLNREIADIHVYLGVAYEEVRRVDDALTEYSEATKLDNWNLNACMYKATVLVRLRQPIKARQEANGCLELSSKIIQDFTTRMHQTSDTWSRQWLQAQIDEYKRTNTAFNARIPVRPRGGHRKVQ